MTFVGVLQAIGKDFAKGLKWAVQFGVPAERLVALLFPGAAPTALGLANATVLIQNAVLLVEQKYAASGTQAGTGTAKLAEVVTLAGDAVTALLVKAGVTGDGGVPGEADLCGGCDFERAAGCSAYTGQQVRKARGAGMDMEMEVVELNASDALVDRLMSAAVALEQAAERVLGVELQASRHELEERLAEAEATIVALKAAGRKTGAAGVGRLVAKEGGAGDGGVDAALGSLSVEQRIAVKAGLMRAGLLG